MSRYGAAVRPASEVQDWMSITTGGVASGTPVNGYQTPADWLVLPTVTAGEQKIVGIVAIRPAGPNRLAIKVSGAYTVDWGDGSAPANFATGTVASHAYTWADIPAATLTSSGYRQVLVTVTMQAAQTMTSVHFDALHPSSQSTTLAGWIDVRMAGSSVSTLDVFGYDGGHARDIERFDYVGTNSITDFSVMFWDLTKLRQVVNLSTANATDTWWMFYGCNALVSVPAFDLSNVIDANAMFLDCGQFVEIPAFTMNTTTTMECGAMFDGTNARRVGAMNLLKVKGARFLSTQGIEKYSATNSRIVVDLSDSELTGAELNTAYTNLATITDTDRTISTITYNWDLMQATYTTTANHGWVEGMRVSVSGVTPAQFNTGEEIEDVPAANKFMWTLTSVPASDYVSGGSVAHETWIDVYDTEGSTSDTPSIATGKGWMVVS
jgi:hypothetical protein